MLPRITSFGAEDSDSSRSIGAAGLKENLLASIARSATVGEELTRILVGFWSGKVIADAVPFSFNGTTMKIFLSRDLTPSMAENVCVNLRTGPRLSGLACVVRGSGFVGVVMGASHPPDALGEWIMRNVENLDPSTTL